MNIITTPDNSRRRVAAVGMYDGVHLGHRYLIDFLKLEGHHRSLEPAVVTFSRHPLSLVRPLEAPQLLNTLSDRVDLINEAGVDDIILLSFNDRLRRLSAEDFLKMLRKQFGIMTLVVGFNNRLGHDRVDSLEKFREIGAKAGVDVVLAPEYRHKSSAAGVSSSVIRHALLEGRPDTAAELLGRPYSIRGMVVRGNKVGSTIGFPTANIELDDESVLIPLPGAYAAYVTTPDGERRPAMVNIGFRPTVASAEPEAEHAPGKLSIEAHIIDYNGYLYDDILKLEFIKYLRPERRFSSTSRLASQLKTDLHDARKALE